MPNSDIQKALAEHKASEPHGSTLGPYIQDIVYGATDGIITTFAVVSGSSGADLAQSIVIILGFANLFADGVSMGMGNYLSLRSKRDHYQRTWKEEMREIEMTPEIEREEIREIFAQKGFSGEDLERATQVITSNKNVWAEMMMREEHGLAPEDTEHPVLHGFMTFISFVVFGAIPLTPYFLQITIENRFGVAIGATAVALLVLGLLRSYITRERMFRGPLEILSIGAVCAVIAYGVGVGLKGLVGVAL